MQFGRMPFVRVADTHILLMENDQGPLPAGTGDVDDPVICVLSPIFSYYACHSYVSHPFNVYTQRIVVTICFFPGFIGGPSPIIPRHVLLFCVSITAQACPVSCAVYNNAYL